MRKIIYFCLLGFLGVGLYLGLKNLGYYSLLQTDDGLTVLAIKNIMKYGYSAFPSGAFYPKELLYTYPTAWICNIFGMNEFTLRVFNLPFSIGSILLIYLLGKEVFDEKIGILSAGILTFSIWQLEFTRYVRSYIVLQFLFILSTYLFFKVFVKEEKINIVMVFFFFLLTLIASPWGVMLIVPFLSLFLIKGRDFFKAKTLIFLLFFTACAVLFHLVYAVFADNFLIKFAGESHSVINIAKRLPLPRWDILFHFILHQPFIWLFLLSISFLFSIYIIRGKQDHKTFLCLMILFSLFDLPEIGLLVFSAYTIMFRGKIRFLKERPIIIGLVILALGILWWSSYGLFFWKGGSVIKNINLVTFPSWVYYLYLSVPFPKMSFIVIVGLFILYFRSFKGEGSRNSIFLGSLFVGIILFMQLPIRHSAPRYNFPIYPLFILIYSFSIIQITRWAPRLVRLALLIVFLLLTVEHAGPLHAYYAANLSHGDPVIEPYIATSYSITHYFDEKSAGEFVKAHMDKDDVIIAQERILQYYYIGKMDYSLYLLFADEYSITGEEIIEKGSLYSDCYIKSGTIYTVQALKEIIGKNIKEGGAVWLIVRNYYRLKGPQRNSVYDLKHAYQKLDALLKDNAPSLKFVARDNLTEVYRFDKKSLL